MDINTKSCAYFDEWASEVFGGAPSVCMAKASFISRGEVCCFNGKNQAGWHQFLYYQERAEKRLKQMNLTSN